MKNFLENLCDFIHEAQKERGLVALHLRSKEGEFCQEMEQQFAVVDHEFRPLGSLPRKQSSRIEPFLHAMKYLPARRKYVIGRMVEPKEALNFYTLDLITPAIEIAHEIAVLDSSNQPAKIAAFVNFLYWKERVGLERALGTQLMDTKWEKSADLRTRLEYIISEQQAYERMFLALADHTGKQAIEELKAHNSVFQRIERINQLVTSQGLTAGLKDVSAREWFDLFTAKIDLLHKIEKNIAANLRQGSPSQSLQKKETLSQPLPAEMENLHTLPLFTGLDSFTIYDILKHARVVSHAKGAMIFVEGEQASRFYVVLEGWVKLFKGNQEGQESILQLVTTGEQLIESVLFSNGPFPVSAQAVESIRLLSIPATLLREKLQNNRDLAMNMLSTVAGRSQALISQFEQLTLKNVTQRVGWFVLKLLLDNGENTDNLRLPYDKSLIAGLLGMKPETFSRTLQNLKGHGIELDRNTVSIRDIYSLCEYCDTDLAGKCSRSGDENCHHPFSNFRN
jgi:CRP-like cAMP-binding protein